MLIEKLLLIMIENEYELLKVQLFNEQMLLHKVSHLFSSFCSFCLFKV